MMIISSTPKGMLDVLMRECNYTIPEIAYAINRSQATLWRILQGHTAQPETSQCLLILYLQAKIIEEMKREKKYQSLFSGKQPLTLKQNSKLIFRAKRMIQNKVLN